MTERGARREAQGRGEGEMGRVVERCAEKTRKRRRLPSKEASY